MTTSTPVDSPLSAENTEATTRAVQAAMTQQGSSKEQVAFAGHLLRDDKMREEIAALEVRRQREHASFLEWLIELIKAVFALVWGVVEGVVTAITTKETPPMPAAAFAEKNRAGLEDMFDRPDAQRSNGKGKSFKKGGGPAQVDDSAQSEQAQPAAEREPKPKKRKGFAAAPTQVDDEPVAVSGNDHDLDEDGLTSYERMSVEYGDTSLTELMEEKRQIAEREQEREAEKRAGRGSDKKTGTLIEHGPAHYGFNPAESMSYYVKVQNTDGQEYTQWGKELADAMINAEPEKGDLIKMINLGKVPVEIDKRIKEGDRYITRKETVQRNSWRVDILEKAPQQNPGAPRIVRVK